MSHPSLCRAIPVVSRWRIRALATLALLLTASACSDGIGTEGTGGAESGFVPGDDGGYVPATGGSDPGMSTGGGGAIDGGTGAAASGGAFGGGGTDTGGVGSGGLDSGAGGADTGGVGGTGGTGGAGGTGGSGGSTFCPLPSSFEWTSSGALAQPKSPAGANWASLKDFSITRHGDHYVVYATVYNSTGSNTGWQGVYIQFSDFAQMGAADQAFKQGMVAPQIMYFAPKNLWVLTYQWGFKYATSTNPSNPASWSATSSLLNGDPTVGHPSGTGPIDQTVICDDTNCYMFFAGDNGYIYRASMPIANFPGTYQAANVQVVLMDEKFKLFEGVEVYKVKGENKYLMIVEAGDGGPRYFRAFTATSLGGTWTAMPSASTRATPFAGLNNVTFSGSAWTSDISHGDIVREDPSEKKEVDMCNLQFLYQGRSPTSSGDYGLLPYRPGLLTLVTD